MKSFFTRRSSFLLVLGCIVLFGALFTYLFTGSKSGTQPNASAEISTAMATSVVPNQAHTQPLKPCSLKQNFQMGVSFPQWSPAGYGASDAKWLTELPQMRQQTAACWVGMPILFNQASLSSTVVTTGISTPSTTSFAYGVRYAQSLGLHVFMTPLIDVDGPQSWSGSIAFSTYDQEQQWFTSYWQAIKPYVTVAAQLGVEQLAIGTEYEWLQQNAPDTLWNGLIANIRSIYHGTLTYDMNWTSLQYKPPTWMHNPALKFIGVSAYLPIVNTQERIDPTQMFDLWKGTVKLSLDNFAKALGEPILVSEIGYRNSADALYHSWETTSTTLADPVEQAGACDAALANITPDPNILGVFFWGWDDTGSFSLKGLQAASIIRTHYSSLQA